jgi:ABC-type polysaccharide/polyol phosphate export permease
MDQDRSFFLSSIVILLLVGLGQAVYGIILLTILPALILQLGALVIIGLGLFFAILAVVDYLGVSEGQHP